MADPANEFVKEKKELQGRKKTMTAEEFEDQSARLSYLGSLYWDDGGLYFPGYNILRSWSEGAVRVARGLGGKLDDAVLDYTERCLIDPYSAKFGSAEDLLKAGLALTVMGRVPPRTGSRVPITRPSFPIQPDPWMINFSLTFDPELISRQEVLLSAVAAGKYKGIGDGRTKGFRRGRYSVEVLD
jgi:hypothetical protein